jgi:hypothetical protein
VSLQPNKTLPTVESSPSQPARPSPYRSRWVLALVGLGLLGLGVLVFVATMPRQQPAVPPALAAAEPKPSLDLPAEGADQVASPLGTNRTPQPEPSDGSNAAPQAPARESARASLATEGGVAATDGPTRTAGTARRAAAMEPPSSPPARPSTSAPKLPRRETRLKTK